MDALIPNFFIWMRFNPGSVEITDDLSSNFYIFFRVSYRNVHISFISHNNIQFKTNFGGILWSKSYIFMFLYVNCSRLTDWRVGSERQGADDFKAKVPGVGSGGRGPTTSRRRSPVSGAEAASRDGVCPTTLDASEEMPGLSRA